MGAQFALCESSSHGHSHGVILMSHSHSVIMWFGHGVMIVGHMGKVSS